jgi:hypothetical protein
MFEAGVTRHLNGATIRTNGGAALMFNIPEDLATMPSDAHGVCELISRFLEGWNVAAVNSPDPTALEDVAMAEGRLGLALPAALHWIFTHVGVDNSIIGRQDPFVHPANMAVDDLGVITYRIENQNCAAWGVRTGDITALDPPVVWRDLQTDGDWRPYHERLSIDLLEVALSEAMLLPDANVRQAELHAGAPLQLKDLSRIAIPRHTFWAMPDGGQVEWYGLPDCLIRNDANVWLWAFGRTTKDVERAVEAVPADWSTLED